jgi:hypothetical protein
VGRAPQGATDPGTYCLIASTARTDGQRDETADRTSEDAYLVAQGQKIEEEISARGQR